MKQVTELIIRKRRDQDGKVSYVGFYPATLLGERFIVCT